MTPTMRSRALRTSATLRSPRRRRDRGVASLEYLGMLPFLLLIALAGIQLGIAAYCGEQAGTAARTAARAAAQAHTQPDLQAVGDQAVSGWVNPRIEPSYGASSVTVTATVQVPSVLPGLSFIDPISRSATMPKEDDTP
jgi:hypothetical protein